MKQQKLRIIKEEKLASDCIYQELFTSKDIYVERYSYPHKKIQLEVLIFAGLNILPASKYFGYFPFNLCKEIQANVSVIYEPGCGPKFNHYFRRFAQKEAEEQYFAGFELLKNFKGKVIIFSHSASTIEHFKLIFEDKYKNFSEGLHIAGGIIAGSVTNIVVELKKLWPNYKFLNWKNIIQSTGPFNIALPMYPYYHKKWHAKYSPMRHLSVWINLRSIEFLLGTNVKQIILSGKKSDYPLLLFICKHDKIFSPRLQEILVKFISKNAEAYINKCDCEHNLFVSDGTFGILQSIKEYLNKI